MKENEVQGSDDEGIKKRRGNCGDDRTRDHLAKRAKYNKDWALK
jgi:hypothetical protein